MIFLQLFRARYDEIVCYNHMTLLTIDGQYYDGLCQQKIMQHALCERMSNNVYLCIAAMSSAVSADCCAKEPWRVEWQCHLHRHRE